MFFLLRVAFWVTVVLVLLPSGGGSQQPDAPRATFGATEAVVAASAAVSDMSGFCERQPEACKVGAQAATVLTQRAQAGARMVYTFVNQQWVHADQSAVAKLEPSPDAVGTILTVPASQHTLLPSDLEPAWQGPLAQADTVPLPRPRKTPGKA